MPTLVAVLAVLGYLIKIERRITRLETLILNGIRGKEGKRDST